MLSVDAASSLHTCVLERIAAGEPSAVNDCIHQYGGLIWSLARRLTRTPSDAEDATQEIFVNIWSCASTFDPAKGSEIVFIAMIARRRLIDRRRKWKSELTIDSSVDVTEAQAWTDPGSSPQVHQEAECAMKALQLLGPQQRQMLELGFVYGMSQSAISSHLSIPLGTVKSSMRRGLVQVRKYLKIEDSGSLGIHAAPLPIAALAINASRKRRRAPAAILVREWHGLD